MNKFIVLSLFILGLIHILPVSGILGAQKLNLLYGIQLTEADSDLQILLRHRAVLFAIIGGLLWASIAIPSLRTTAIVIGYVSVTSFIVIACTSDQHSVEITRVLKVDFFALVLLFAVSWGLLFDYCQHAVEYS